MFSPKGFPMSRTLAELKKEFITIRMVQVEWWRWSDGRFVSLEQKQGKVTGGN